MHSDNIDVIEHHFVTDLSETKQWSKRYKLPINHKKTTCMAAGTRRLGGSREKELILDGVSIQNVTNLKLLGVYINENLNWSAQIDYLCSNLYSRISLLRQLSEYMYVPSEVQMQYYQSYILPFIDYGSVVWGSASMSNVERLYNLQKRAARIILKAEFQLASADMFNELRWQSVPSRLKYNKAVLTYKAINYMTPEYLSNLLKPVSQTYYLNLRSSENGILHVPRHSIMEHLFCS